MSDCKYYDKENNTCYHYHSGFCRKLLMECALSEQIERWEIK